MCCLGKYLTLIGIQISHLHHRYSHSPDTGRGADRRITRLLLRPLLPQAHCAPSQLLNLGSRQSARRAQKRSHLPRVLLDDSWKIRSDLAGKCQQLIRILAENVGNPADSFLAGGWKRIPRDLRQVRRANRGALGKLPEADFLCLPEGSNVGAESLLLGLVCHCHLSKTV